MKLRHLFLPNPGLDKALLNEVMKCAQRRQRPIGITMKSRRPRIVSGYFSKHVHAFMFRGDFID